jgi:hypothetical protein
MIFPSNCPTTLLIASLAFHALQALPPALELTLKVAPAKMQIGDHSVVLTIRAGAAQPAIRVRIPSRSNRRAGSSRSHPRHSRPQRSM